MNTKTRLTRATDDYMLAASICHGGGTPVYPTRRERCTLVCRQAWRRYHGFVALQNRAGEK